MAKIRITESTLRKMVREAISNVLNEEVDTFDRGIWDELASFLNEKGIETYVIGKGNGIYYLSVPQESEKSAVNLSNSFVKEYGLTAYSNMYPAACHIYLRNY